MACHCSVTQLFIMRRLNLFCYVNYGHENMRLTKSSITMASFLFKWIKITISFCIVLRFERIVIEKRLTCVCTWHNILLLLPAAFCVSETAVSFGLIVWSFVIFRRWCACTQLSQMNSEHSTHHDVAFASSAQLLHLMISFCVSLIDFVQKKGNKSGK